MGSSKIRQRSDKTRKLYQYNITRQLLSKDTINNFCKKQPSQVAFCLSILTYLTKAREKESTRFILSQYISRYCETACYCQ